ADLQYFAPVGVSNYITSDPVRTVVETVPAPVLTFRNASYDSVVSVSGLEDRLFVQVAAPLCNTNPFVTTSNLVVLRSERTGDQETVMAVETAPGSGLFRFPVGCPLRDATSFPPKPNDGYLEVVAGDRVFASADGCGGGEVLSSIVIDPGGV